MLKREAAGAVHHKIVGFRIVVVLVAPAAHGRCTITNFCIRFGIKQPKRNIHALDLVDMIFVLENFRKKALLSDIILQPLLCRLFVKPKRDHIIRAQRAAELLCHNDRIAAKRAGGCRKSIIPDNFAPAGFANIGMQL